MAPGGRRAREGGVGPVGHTLPHLDSTLRTNTMGHLCPHGGSVKGWLTEGVSSLSSAQGHMWHRAGNDHAVGIPPTTALSPSPSPGSEDVTFGRAFFSSRIWDPLPAPGMGFGKGAGDQLRWDVLPKARCLTPLLLPAGDAGGRLGGWQNLPAGAVQRWRFPRRQLHFHGWDRLQGKCLGGSLAPACGVWQVSDGRGVTKPGYKDVTLVVPICDSASRAPRG